MQSLEKCVLILQLLVFTTKQNHYLEKRKSEKGLDIIIQLRKNF